MVFGFRLVLNILVLFGNPANRICEIMQKTSMMTHGVPFLWVHSQNKSIYPR